MEKYSETRVVNTFVYLLEVVLSVIFIFQQDNFPKAVIFGIASYLIFTVLIMDTLYRQNLVNYGSFAKIQLLFFMIISVIMCYVFHSQVVLYVVMFVNSICTLMYLNQTLNRMQMTGNILLLIVMALLGYPGLEDAVLSETDSLTCFIAVIIIGWLEAVGTGMMCFYIQKNSDQEQSLDDLLKVVELKCEEEEKIAKKRSQFLENVSYEIGDPINTMLEKTKMIMEETKEPATAEYAKAVDRSGQILHSMVDYMLDLSRIELGKVEVIPVKYQLSLLLRDIYDRMLPKAEEKGLGFSIEHNYQMPSQFYGDEGKLRQIISILISNAIKFSEFGSVTIKVDYEKQENDGSVPVQENDDSAPAPEKDESVSFSKEWLGKKVLLCISVIDTGSGVKEKDKEKLYQEFLREGGQNGFLYSETGLGLAVANRLVSMMEGTIGFDNNAGGGTIFWFKIPQYVISFQPIGGIELRE